MALICSQCGTKQGFMAGLTRDVGAAPESYICDKCQTVNALQKAEEKRALREAATKVIVTTTHGVDGYHIVDYLGIESVEFVLGTGMFSDGATSIQDFLGKRASVFEKKLQKAKQITFQALKMIAAEKGANAVVGIDLDYTEFSGNRIGLVLNGTLVRLEPNQRLV
jgi:uncharacterized protein YbjQ (UPF0145 family)